MGNGELVIDINQKRGKQTGKRKIIPDALCPIPYAQFPMPYSPCPMPYAPFPIPIKEFGISELLELNFQSKD